MASPNSPASPPQLKGRDLQIFSLHMLGKTNLEIAALVGVTAQTVSNTINTPYFQEAKRRVFDETINEITKNASGAFSPLTIAKAAAGRLMARNIALAENAKSEQVQAACIKDVLDRVIGKPTQRIAVEDLTDSIIDRMSDEEMEAYCKDGIIPAWAKDAGLSNGPDTVH